MTAIDWLLIALPVGLVFLLALYTRRYVRSVADFLSAGRCAGRYLLANAKGESDSGLANTMAKFEVVLVSGFVLNFWEKISIPVLLLLGISGFVAYRFRETRALTLAQFLEARYSRKYRLFMGVLAFISGILNYGIFPAVSARFFIYFLKLPTSVLVGGMEVSTLSVLMFSYLAITVMMTTLGGQVTLLVTDCVEGILSHAIYIVVIIAICFVVHWSQVIQVMSMASPGHSFIDPFDAHEVEDFNIWYVGMSLLITAYSTMAFQNKQGFNSAARTAHESRMGTVLGQWRAYARLLMILLLGLAAVTYLQHPDFASTSASISIHQEIGQIGDPYIRKQMTVPITLSYLLPTGVKGLFLAVMVMGLFAGDSGHMHSWGSILVQDVILPLRKKPLSTRGHMLALRASIVGVAVFAFLFSLLFQQTQYIALWWSLTSGVFVGGAGAAIIGGLYWSRGTTAGAWAAQLTGSTLALIGIVLTNRIAWQWIVAHWLTPSFPHVNWPATFWINGLQVTFIAALTACAVYVAVSLRTSRGDFNLKKLLHRGEYAPPGETTLPLVSMRERFRLRNILRFDKNFTLTDKIVSAGIFWWAMVLLTVNVVVSIWNLAFYHWPITWWSRYWAITAVGFPFLVALVTLVWFAIGGARDMVAFFKALRLMKRDTSDDGRVVEDVGGADQPTGTIDSDAAASSAAVSTHLPARDHSNRPASAGRQAESKQ